MTRVYQLLLQKRKKNDHSCVEKKKVTITNKVCSNKGEKAGTTGRRTKFSTLNDIQIFHPYKSSI
jgi:hypothetical protein